ncbi:MAG: hypothetical protein JXA94_03290 [Parachlamydiales bacterium]|nr:hypothetical protein [Parachlamydiales bacterium]
MKKILRKVFGIFPGEEKNILRFIRLSIVWAIGSCLAETLAISLFTEKIGAEFLSYTYLITAIVMIGVSCLYMYFLKLISAYKIMNITMTVAAVVYTMITLTLFFNPPKIFWIFLQIFSYTFGSSLSACFWIFIDQYHDLQDAKKIYSVYNSAYFLGFIISGTLINLTYKFLGPAILFLIVVITMIHSILETKNIARTIPIMEDDGTEDFFVSGTKSFSSILIKIIKSPFAISLVLMSCIVWLLRTYTEYGYLQTLQKILLTDKSFISNSSIPEFLGKSKAIISAVNLIIGMFFYRNLIRRVGIANVILLPPIYFILLYNQWFFYDTLFVAILGIIAVEGILYTLEDNNFSLLINAADAKLKDPLRIINNSFFEPVGMLFSSFFLIFFHSHNVIFGFILAIVFLALSFLVRRYYPKSIFSSLKLNKIHFERKTKDWIKTFSKKEKLQMEKDLINYLNSADENKEVLAIKTLVEFEDPKVLNTLLNKINDLSTYAKVKIIDIFNDSIFSSHPKVIELIKKFNKHETDSFLSRYAHLYLAKRGLINPEDVIKDLDSEDVYLKAASIITLKHSNTNQEFAFNRTIAKTKTDFLLNSYDINEIVIGLEILNHDDTDEAVKKVINFISHENLKIKRKAAKALANITDEADRIHTSKILNELRLTNDNAFRKNLIIALGNINDSSIVKEILKISKSFRPNEKLLIEKIITSMGEKVSDILLSIIEDSKWNESSRILAIKILAKISIDKLQNNVKSITLKEIKKAHYYYYFSNTLEKKYSLYDLSILKSALQSGYRSTINFIIHLLSETSPIEDPELVLKSLYSKNAKTNAHAIETLEKNIKRSLYIKIRTLIDDTPKDYKLQESEMHIEEKHPTLFELINTLEEFDLFIDRIIPNHLKTKIKIEDFNKSKESKLKKSKKPISQYTYEAFET